MITQFKIYKEKCLRNSDLTEHYCLTVYDCVFPRTVTFFVHKHYFFAIMFKFFLITTVIAFGRLYIFFILMFINNCT